MVLSTLHLEIAPLVDGLGLVLQLSLVKLMDIRGNTRQKTKPKQTNKQTIFFVIMDNPFKLFKKICSIVLGSASIMASV